MNIKDLCKEECFAITYGIQSDELNKMFKEKGNRYCSDSAFVLNIEPDGKIRGVACRKKKEIGNILDKEIIIDRRARKCNYAGKNECFNCWNIIVSDNEQLCNNFIDTIYSEQEIKVSLGSCDENLRKRINQNPQEEVKEIPQEEVKEINHFKRSIKDIQMYTEFNDGTKALHNSDWTVNNCSINMNYCSYGITGIYIGPDGEVLRAPCHIANNVICNIDEVDKIEVPKEISICAEPEEKCIMCGSAMFSKDKDILLKHIKEWEEVITRK